MTMESRNPVLGRIGDECVMSGEAKMTVKGAVDKSAVLLAIIVASAAMVWSAVDGGANTESLGSWAMFGCIGGLVLGLTTCFIPRHARFLAPAYALVEGAAVGAVSAWYETKCPGLVMQAVFLTFSIMLAMLYLYRSGTIKVTSGFVRGLSAATGGVLIFYIGAMLMNAFVGVHVPYLHSGGWMGLGIGAVIIAIASLNLVLDFAVMEEGARRGAAQRYEWYAAFGLMVTLVWLYFEVLRWLGIWRSD